MDEDWVRARCSVLLLLPNLLPTKSRIMDLMSLEARHLSPIQESWGLHRPGVIPAGRDAQPRAGKAFAGTSCMQKRMKDHCPGLWFPYD